CSFIVFVFPFFFFFFFFFFFSSRRRHTRFSRDWSSDVCSSDLFLPPGSLRYSLPAKACFDFAGAPVPAKCHALLCKGARLRRGRSEERRVGKECRCGWWADQ